MSLLLRAVLCLVLGAALSARASKPVRIGVEFNAPPLSFTDKKGRPDGFTAALLAEMERAGGPRFEVVANSWTNILSEFNAGRLDALANVTITDERHQTMEFSIHHAVVHGVTYTRPGEPPMVRTAQFAGKRMLTLSGGMSHINAVRHQGWGASIVALGSWKDILETVRDGGADFALLMRPLKFEQPDEMGLHREFVEDILHEYHIAVHQGDSATLEQINEALATVRASGAFDRLYAKWIGPIEPRPIRMIDLRPYYLPTGLIAIALAGLFLWQRRVNLRLAKQGRALEESEAKYRQFIESTSEMIFVLQDGLFQYANRQTLALVGGGKDSLIGRPLTDFVAPEEQAIAAQRNQKVLSGESHESRREYRIVTPDGREAWLAVNATRTEWEGRPATLHFASDATERHRSELLIRTSLREKEALLSEVHHRVKNNLQVITSLLRLEAGKNHQVETKVALRDMQSRIRSMSLLHETLYRSGNFSDLDLAAYVRTLATQLFRAQNIHPSAVRLELELQPVSIDIDRAVPCGLIINELLTNSLKHAFPEGRSGEVRVSLQTVAEGANVQLIVSDNGVGLPDKRPGLSENSLGLTLTTDLAGQLQGTMEIGAVRPGACFTLTFPAVKAGSKGQRSASPFPPTANGNLNGSAESGAAS